MNHHRLNLNGEKKERTNEQASRGSDSDSKAKQSKRMNEHRIFFVCSLPEVDLLRRSKEDIVFLLYRLSCLC